MGQALDHLMTNAEFQALPARILDFVFTLPMALRRLDEKTGFQGAPGWNLVAAEIQLIHHEVATTGAGHHRSASRAVEGVDEAGGKSHWLSRMWSVNTSKSMDHLESIPHYTARPTYFTTNTDSPYMVSPEELSRAVLYLYCINRHHTHLLLKWSIEPGKADAKTGSGDESAGAAALLVSPDAPLSLKQCDISVVGEAHPCDLQQGLNHSEDNSAGASEDCCISEVALSSAGPGIGPGQRAVSRSAKPSRPLELT
eukprot:gnl/TRDRNA2_/TRDRNA2_162131_c0_seq2.p1 gnl/TRDRNA2_/TRDRNA2_162131_c0~~gnl/TRDRNA2_/TRDRNA2_162131_c0_seq2.p1  ORF type:complete len:268 (-),score=33.68 gnl/TRDRNA2_/TRDRNA2_162131_c0_seq2:143-907(-)